VGRVPSIKQQDDSTREQRAEEGRDRWYKTGDIGEIDESDYVKIIDRNKRIIVLSTGKNVAPQPIENAMDESDYIENTMIFGEKQKYIICLVNPDFENLKTWAERKGIKETDPTSLAENEQVRALIEQEIAQRTEELDRSETP